MEIQALRLMVSDEDLNRLLSERLPINGQVRDLRAEILPEGLLLRGRYPTMMLSVPFTSYWKPSVVGRALHIRLDRIKIVGVPAGLLRGMFLNSLKKLSEGLSGLHVELDHVVLDLDRYLQSKGITMRTNLQTVSCELGHLIVHASS